jgi:nucleotidyltransferase substrate binding protein (TIGR01987 family)
VTVEAGAVLDTLGRALVRLRSAVEQPKTEWTRDSAIQRFEFTFELAWRAVARLAREEGIECPSPRAALKTALKLGWIADDENWLTMLDDRNRTSHTYNEATAEDLYTRLRSHLVALTGLHAGLTEVARR